MRTQAPMYKDDHNLSDGEDVMKTIWVEWLPEPLCKIAMEAWDGRLHAHLNASRTESKEKKNTLEQENKKLKAQKIAEQKEKNELKKELKEKDDEIEALKAQLAKVESEQQKEK